MALFIPVVGPVERVSKLYVGYKFNVPTKVFPRWCTIDLVVGESGRTYSYDVVVEDVLPQDIPRPNWRASLIAHPLLINKYNAYLSGNVMIIPRSNSIHYTIEDYEDIYSGVAILDDTSNLKLVMANIGAAEETEDILKRVKYTLEYQNCPSGFTVTELKNLCKMRGLPSRGTKIMVCERLLQVMA